MPQLRSWLAIPAIAAAAGVGAALVGCEPIAAFAAAVLAAALTAAIRAFVGTSLAASIVAAAGAALGVLGWLAVGGDARAALAGAAGLFAICELVRPREPTAAPLPAVGAALLAAALDPTYAPLVAVTGAFWLASPLPRPRWAIAAPVLGVALSVVAVAATLATHGALARLALTWAGHARGHVSPWITLRRAGDLLGPLTSVAALAGLVSCMVRGRHAAAAVASTVAFAALGDLASGTLGASTPLVAALAAGVALGRFAALVRMPAGQTFAGATAGALLVAVPAWTLAASL